MFIRCEFHHPAQRIELIDEDFRCILNPTYNITEENKHIIDLCSLIHEYKVRGKDIGHNLALFINWFHREGNVSDTVEWMKKACPKVIEGWPEIERSMESYLKLLKIWS